MIIEIAGKRLAIEHIKGPLGVRGRNSDNALIREKLDWAPVAPLKRGFAKTYPWIAKQVKRASVGGSDLDVNLSSLCNSSRRL